jgi:hypothetical protein
VIKVSSTEILPYEPVSFDLTLVNEGSKPVELIGPPGGVVRLGVAHKDQIDWVTSFSQRLGGPPLPPKKLVFSPGATITIQRHAPYDVSGEGLRYFQKPGQVYVLGVIRFAKHHFEAKPITITVVQPKAADREAYNFLSSITDQPSKKALWRYFAFEECYGVGVNQETINALTNFANKFTNSQYAQYAQLAVGMLYAFGTPSQPNLERATPILRKIAASKNNRLAARAHYCLSKLAEPAKIIEEEKPAVRPSPTPDVQQFIEAAQHRREAQGLPPLTPEEINQLLTLSGFASREQVTREMCQQRMRQIALAAKAAAWDNPREKAFPPSLAWLVEKGYLRDLKVFVDPSNPNPPIIQNALDTDDKSDFVYVGAGLVDSDTPKIILYSKRHHGKVRNVVFTDGRSVWMQEDEFQTQLRREQDRR